MNTTHTIPQGAPRPQNGTSTTASPLSGGIEGGTPKHNGAICKYCAAEALGNTNPPLCARHMDMAVLINFAQSSQQPVTPESLAAIYQKAAARGGRWDIAETEIPDLLSQLLAEA